MQPNQKNTVTSRWRHNEHDGVSNHRRLNCLPIHLFRQKISKLSVTSPCEGNPPVTCDAENVSIWWRHYGASAPSVCNVPLSWTVSSITGYTASRTVWEHSYQQHLAFSAVEHNGRFQPSRSFITSNDLPPLPMIQCGKAGAGGRHMIPAATKAPRENMCW